MTASHDVSPSANRTNSDARATPPGPVLLAGVLLDSARDEPVAGVVVRARLDLAARSEPVDDGADGPPNQDPADGPPHHGPADGPPDYGPAAADVATARTGADGSFGLALSADLPPWLRRAVTCGGGESIELFASVDGAERHVATVRLADPTPDRAVYRVDVASGEADWPSVAALARRAGVSRVNDLVRLLRDPSVVTDPGQRRAALTALEAAFLDPQGVLVRHAPLPAWHQLSADLPAYRTALGRAAGFDNVSAALRELNDRLNSFDDLGQVDWPLDVRGLGELPVSEVINQHAPEFTKGGLSFGRPWLFADPLLGYRDYLVGVWQTLAATDYYWAYQTKLDGIQARDQLQHRFHQDFTTVDTAPAGANEVLIPIVTRILTDPVPTGSGLAPGAVPARGPATARAHLDALIALSGQTATELGLRYRLDLTHDDAAQTSPVEQNIAALLGLFRDSFQSAPDPFHTAPDVRNDTLIPHWQLGRAPFFLEYEEWLAATAPFYPENQLSMTRTLRPVELATVAHGWPKTDPLFAWMQDAAGVLDQIASVDGLIAGGEYMIALDRLEVSRNKALGLVGDRVKAGYEVEPPLKARRAYKIIDKPSLLHFERFLGFPSSSGNPTPYTFSPGTEWNADRITAALVLYVAYLHWLWRSDVLLAAGRFTEATTSIESLVDVAIGAAEADSPAGYFDYWNDGQPYLYTAGPLPYTTDRSDNRQHVMPWFTDEKYEGTGGIADADFPPYRTAGLLHRVDQRFVALRLGNVLLEWADALLRADDAPSAARARELYKAVLWLHGEDPKISPTWEVAFAHLPGGGPYVAAQRNPAVVSQTTRAWLGFTKVESGLNWFGTSDDVVPVQRYRTLKDAADRFAALAKAAERDFLAVIANLENLSIEQMRTSNLLGKARAQKSIAGEQAEIAKFNVKVAQQQVADVKTQIAAKQAEIADHDSFFGQLGDFASGLTKTFSGAPGFLTTGIKDGVAAEAGVGDASAEGVLGLGAGASVLAGFGLFWYAGTVSMSGMAAAMNSRAGELHRLQDVTLALAEGSVGARTRDVTIAGLQATIADADIRLAQDLMAFHTQRLLNAEFWTAVAQVLRRVLRRYLDLGAWAGWLAERALAFEQNRKLRLVRMDYLSRAMQGVTGGDLLQGDLAELEAARISGERAMVDFHYAFSLAEEYPLAFGALKAHGRCSFSTEEAAARACFPGTYGLRVRTVEVSVRVLPAGRRVRGVLVNHGVSLASVDESLAARPVLRFPDALAVSETRAPTAADGRRDEVLSTFEGTGLDTSWTLQLDRQSSAGWWDAITDVVIDVQGSARYSEVVRTAPTVPAPRRRFTLLAGSAFAPDAVKAVRAAGHGPVAFDVRSFPFAAEEKNRRVTNAMVLLPGATGSGITGRLSLASTGTVVDFTFAEGVALSNGEPLRLPGSLTADEPLNQAIGAPVEQVWRLDLNAPGPKQLTGLVGVVLGIEYTADPI